MKVFALLTDAFGGHGGISVFNRDFLSAILSGAPDATVLAVPRVIGRETGDLPSGLEYRVEGARGARAYLAAVLSELAVVRQADVIYCAHVNLAPLAWLLKQLSGRPVLCALYGIEAWTPPKRRVTAWCVRRMDRFYAISEFTRTRFAAWSQVPVEKIDLLPNAIHLEDYAPGPKSKTLLERWNIGPGPILMTFGRLVSRDRAKGFDEVLDVLPRLLEHYPSLTYIIAGDGDDRDRLASRVKHEGLERHVVFTGFVDEDEKADLYRLADLYVMPSRGEGFGFVFLEALACGVPVVASKVDGSRDAVRDGLLGPMVDPDDPDELFLEICNGLNAATREVPKDLKYFAFDEFTKRSKDVLRKTQAA